MQRLGSTQDGMQIYLYQYQGSSPIFRELGRLREISFRTVGEGSGKRRDIDKYRYGLSALGFMGWLTT